MELVNRVNVQDANSEYINSVISSLSHKHKQGLTIIQEVVSNTNFALKNLEQVAGRSDLEMILVTSDDRVYESLNSHCKADNQLVLKGNVEDAKVYIGLSHVLILDESLSLKLGDEAFRLEVDKLYLIDVDNNESVDAKIYQKFLSDNHIEDYKFDGFTIDKIIKETNCLIPSDLIFYHEFSENFTFRFNVWMTNLLALVNLNGHVRRSDSLKVSGKLSRGLTNDLDGIINLIKYVDNILQKRFDDEVAGVLNHFNKMFTSHLRNYIDKGLISKDELIEKLQSYGIKSIYYASLNKGDAKKLVLAYCFPPFNDTSGNVMAKRIFEDKQVVDVISNDMSRIRKKDQKLMNIMSHLLDSQIVLNGAQAFSSWQSIEDYIDGVLHAYKMYSDKYDEMYSRVMFPHSHFAAFELKKINQSIKWVAEFSDPLVTDVSSNLRHAPIEDDDYIEDLKAFVGPKYSDLIDDNSFNVCEVVAFLYADELIFTNKYQLDYMLLRYDEDIQELVKSKAIISQHPTLPRDMYQLVKSFYKVEQDKINIAYFGNFYDTRGFRQIELVAKYLYEANINNFTIHVFTNLNRKTMRFYNQSAFKDYIVMNQYAPYFEFLNLTDLMDALLIFDAETVGIKPYNPYVPSKLSDYRGSLSNIWAFTERESILDQTYEEKLYITRQHDYQKYASTFKQLANDIDKATYQVKNIKCSK